jgi:hypothetical protein
MEVCGRLEGERNRLLCHQHGPQDVDHTNPPPDPLDFSLPLPCHYFDYIVGTSTGGYATRISLS